MRKLKYLASFRIAFLAAVAVGSLARCSSVGQRSGAHEKTQSSETNDATQAQKSFSQAPGQTPQQQATIHLQARKDEFITETQGRIDQMIRVETDLRTRSSRATKPSRQQLANAADDLGGLLKDANARLDDVKTASVDNWIDYRRDVDKAMDRASSQCSDSEALFR